MESAWKRASAGPPSRIVSERHDAAVDVDGREALAIGRGGRGVGHVALLGDDLVAVGDLHERARALQQRLARRAGPRPKRPSPRRAAQHLGGLLAQLLVDRLAAVALDGGEQQRARDRAAERDRQQRRRA